MLLGPASAAMHATSSVLGGHLDLLSMYLIASFAAAYALMRLVRQGAVFFFQVFLLMVAACELVGTIDAEVPVVHIAGNLAFGALLVTAIVVEVVLWRRADGYPHRPAVGRRRRRLDGAGLHHLEPRPGTVVRPHLLAPGPRRLAPAVRCRGVPAVPAVLLTSGSRMRCGRLRSGHDRCRRWIADRRDPYVPGMTGAAHDFDFWIGEWDVFGPEGRQVGRNTITSMFANPAASGMLHEHWHGNGGVEGRSINAYDATRGRWHQTWMDSTGRHAAARRRAGGRCDGARRPGSQRGGPDRGGPAADHLDPGPTDGAEVRQLWESSSDDGATWTVAFDGRYRRR